MKIKGLIFILLTTFLMAKSDYKELKRTFVKTFGGVKKDIANGAVATDDGGAILVGVSKSFQDKREQLLITKINSKGQTQFRAVYGGKKRDGANAVAKLSDGNYLAVGYSESFSKDGDKDAYLVKFAPNGHKIWSKTFGGDRDDEALDVVGVGNGKALVVGYTESFGHGNKDIYLLLIDKNGKKIWSKYLGGSEDDIGYSLALSKDGFFVAGSTESFHTEESEGKDFFLIKYNAKAKIEFIKRYGGDDDDEFKAVTATDDGGCVATGYTKSFDSKHSDIDIIRYSKDGKMLWHKIYGFKSKEWANSIVKTKYGYLIAGTTKSFGFGDFDFYMLEVNQNGSSLWANVYGGSDKDIAKKVIKLSDGSYLVVGKTESFGSGDYDFMEVKLKREK